MLPYWQKQFSEDIWRKNIDQKLKTAFVRIPLLKYLINYQAILESI